MMTRGEAIDALDNLLGMIEDNHCTDYNKAIKMAIDALKQLKQKKGKWLKSYADHEAFGVRPFYRYCSECNELTVWAYNFCPHCGVEMEKEK